MVQMYVFIGLLHAFVDVHDTGYFRKFFKNWLKKVIINLYYL